jgi:hypothetical protein
MFREWWGKFLEADRVTAGHHHPLYLSNFTMRFLQPYAAFVPVSHDMLSAEKM